MRSSRRSIRSSTATDAPDERSSTSSCAGADSLRRWCRRVSLVLATWAADYIDGLTRTRYVGDQDSSPAAEGTDAWISLFAGACGRAVADAEQYERRVLELQDEWRRRLGRVRRGSAVALLLGALPAAPMLTVQSAAPR